MQVTARAHPNIALIKYWGKADVADNLPAVPSLSVTLAELCTETRVEPATTQQFLLNGEPTDDAKLSAFLERVQQEHSIPPLRIESQNNFPTAAGLASSASGFAALVTALNAACELNWSDAELSFWARVGSGSAPRSLYGPFAQITEPDYLAEGIDSAAMPELSVVVAITSRAVKATSSSSGMRASRDTSPYYTAWCESAAADLRAAQAAVAAGDFAGLADAAQHSCMKMHAVMLSTRPPLRYWNAATVGCLDAIDSLQADGVPVFASIDAGPQVKAICVADAAPRVAAELSEVTGVLETRAVGLGSGAHLI